MSVLITIWAIWMISIAITVTSIMKDVQGLKDREIHNLQYRLKYLELRLKKMDEQSIENKGVVR